MSIGLIVTGGFGNGTQDGEIPYIVTMGFDSYIGVSTFKAPRRMVVESGKRLMSGESNSRLMSGDAENRKMTSG